MAKNRFMATLLVAVMLMLMLPVTIASAQEVVLYDDVFNNVYTNDDLSYNRYNNQGNDPEWLAGNIWAAPWGAYGQLRDAEDGSLAVIRGLTAAGVPISNNETQLNKKIIADAIADNSTLEITYDFRTPEKVEYSGAQVWFRFSSTSSSGTSKTWCPFALNISSTGIEPVWAVVQFYPNGYKTVIGREFDRDPNHIKFTWGKDYTVKITLKPDIYGGKNYRYVAEVWEDGDKIGTGIINEWSEITSDVIKTFTGANFNIPTTDPITPEQEPEDLLYIKGIKLKAIQPDVPVNVTYFPEDGCVDAAIDTDVYADFESPVNAVSKSQVTVDGGASVAEVAMGNDDKRVNITLDGVKANTAYTVEIKNVKGKNADSAFDYKWTFTTDGGTEFSEPYFGSSAVVIEEDMADISVADLKVTTPESDGYADGDIWVHSAGSNGQVADVAFTNDGTYLWAKSIVGSTKNFVSKKFDSMRDGSTLTFTGTYRTSKIGGGDAGAAIRLKNNDGSFVIDAIELSRAWNGYTVRSLGTNGNGSAWTDYDGTTFISANWNLDLKDTNYVGAYFNKDTDLSFTLTMQPNADDSTKYDVSVTTGVGGTKTATRQITAEQATSLTTVEILAFNNSSTEEGNFMGVKDLKLETAFGKPYPVVGENIAKIPYTNLSGADFDADVFVVERDAETGKLVKATIINKEDITAESGEIECTFEAVEKGNKLDFYVLNDADSMILLSGKTTFEVGE